MINDMPRIRCITHLLVKVSSSFELSCSEAHFNQVARVCSNTRGALALSENPSVLLKSILGQRKVQGVLWAVVNYCLQVDDIMLSGVSRWSSSEQNACHDLHLSAPNSCVVHEGLIVMKLAAFSVDRRLKQGTAQFCPMKHESSS